MDTVTICNLALLKTGNQAIIALTDNSAAASYCRLLYTPTVNEVMRAADWSFAKAIATLNQLATPPSFDWNYAYQLPSDFSRIVGFNNFDEDDPDVAFEIMGNQLLTDQGTADICYIKNITDANAFDAITVELIALRLGQKLCQPLGRSTQLEQVLANEFNITLKEARRIDATSLGYREKPGYVNSALVNSRWNGASNGWGAGSYQGF